MQKLQLKPKTVKSYYAALEQFKALDVSHETAVRDAFQDLLKECGRQYGWTLVAEWPLKRAGQTTLRADGALVDQFRLRHGLWEAKDSADDLRREAKKKLERRRSSNSDTRRTTSSFSRQNAPSSTRTAHSKVERLKNPNRRRKG